jgi:hypothetical protein
MLAIASLAGPGSAATNPDYVIFPFSQAKALLDQCSRGAPPLGSSGWTPAASDIARFEVALPAALKAEGARQGLASAPKGWGRQYVGMILSGRRVIYGNFFPLRQGEFDDWRASPVTVCDGGQAFFGALYDADRGQMVSVDFNGVG